MPRAAPLNRPNANRAWVKLGIGAQTNAQRRALVVLMGTYDGPVKVLLRETGRTMAVDIDGRVWWVDISGFAVEEP